MVDKATQIIYAVVNLFNAIIADFEFQFYRNILHSSKY